VNESRRGHEANLQECEIHGATQKNEIRVAKVTFIIGNMPYKPELSSPSSVPNSIALMKIVEAVKGGFELGCHRVAASQVQNLVAVFNKES